MIVIQWRISYFVFMLITPTACRQLATPVCPEWCDCVPLTEISDDKSLYHLICEWPHIPDAQVFRTFPVETVGRLSIACTNSAKSKYSAGMFDKFVELRQLSIDNCDPVGDRLPGAFGRGLPRLQTLQLHNLSITAADAGTFADLKSLEKLTITYSSTAHLASNELCSLPDLKYLNLSGNEFPSLDISQCDDDSAKLNQILILDMSRNKITKLSTSNLFSTNFPALRILRLSANSLREIPSKFFDAFQQLQELYLENNRISALNSLPLNLHILDLSNNSLHLIPPQLSQHTNLQRLNLSRNFIDSNSPFLLQNLHQLTSLDLSFNRLHNTNIIGFTNSTNLLDVRLNDNEIRYLEFRTFQNSALLKTLNLANNKIASLTRQHLDGLTDLTDLNLHNNSLSSLDNDVFAPILNLNSLRISQNLFVEAPAALYVLSKLRALDMSENRISKLRKFVFDKFTSLVDLNLSNNKLSILDKSIFEKMSNLRRLDLSSNSLKSFEIGTFNGLISLEELYMQQNLLTFIPPNVFSTLTFGRMQILNVSENRISAVNFVHLPSKLTTLSASHNEIDHVIGGNESSRNSYLKFVDMSYNKLTSLAPYILPSTVEYANFSNNQISAINEHAFNNTWNLTRLDLRANSLIEIDEFSLKIRGALLLSKNPLLCSCRTKWVKQLGVSMQNSLLTNSASNSPILADYNELSCATLIAPLVIRNFHDVSWSEFLCTYRSLCIDTCLCCEYESCDCNNVCPDNCQCYVDAGNSLNFVKCSNWSATVDGRASGDFGTLPMYATSIYLDGKSNAVARLERNSFFGRYRLKRVYLNATGIRSVRPNAFSGVTSLEFVDLSWNSLREFSGDEFFNTPRVEILLLNNNRLKSLGENAFENLPNLKRLTLNDNEFQILPQAIMKASISLETLSLANNPWKCDCEIGKYSLQIWLPSHRNVVIDRDSIYCYENLTDSDNSTVLSLLPATVGHVVKVNFWTFVNEINKTLCYPPIAVEFSPTKYDNVSKYDKRGIFDSQVISDDTVLILIAVSVSGLILLILLIFILCKCRRIVREKALYNKYSTAPSVNSSSNTAPGGGSNCNSPVPLLQYRTFISYSKQDSNFVINELLPRLEQQHNNPYYVCLLHRDFDISNSYSDSTNSSVDAQRLTQDIVGAMERSARVITVVSGNFIKNEWTHSNVRPAYQYLLRYKHAKLVMIVLDDRLPKKLDSMLDHYLRTHRCIFYKDPLFWQKLTDALPSDSLNDSASSNYAEIYGTIVPSRFV